MPNHTETKIAVVPLASEEVEHIVVLTRLHCYNRSLPCGAGALRRHLREQACPHPLPSVRRISEILSRYGLTHGRTGWYTGEDLAWMPPSARVPKARRKHFSMNENGKNR